MCKLQFNGWYNYMHVEHKRCCWWGSSGFTGGWWVGMKMDGVSQGKAGWSGVGRESGKVAVWLGKR